MARLSQSARNLGKDIRLPQLESLPISSRAKTKAPHVPPSDSRNSATLLDLLDSERYYPVFKSLCSCLGIGEIIPLTRTCKKLSSLYQILLKRQWDVDTRLRRFVDDPLRFRSQLRKQSAVISGSFALQFFERVVWEDSDLDIYAQEGKPTTDLAQYLQETEGYDIQMTGKGEEAYIWSPVVQTRTYTRSKQPIGPETKVQIVSVDCIPIEAMLQRFYMTAVMNFITWNKAYAIFPDSTFVHRKMYMLRENGSDIKQGLLKYATRGWKLEELSYWKNETHPHTIQSQRHVGDEFTWVVPFDISNVTNKGIEPYEHHPDTVHFAITNPSPCQEAWYKITTY